MATANGGTLTVTRGMTTVQADGTTIVQLNYTNAGGLTVLQRTLIVRADAVVDQYGNVIVTPVPTALANEIAAFVAQLDTSIANGAAAGKLNL